MAAVVVVAAAAVVVAVADQVAVAVVVVVVDTLSQACTPCSLKAVTAVTEEMVVMEETAVPAVPGVMAVEAAEPSRSVLEETLLCAASYWHEGPAGEQDKMGRQEIRDILVLPDKRVVMEIRILCRMVEMEAKEGWDRGVRRWKRRRWRWWFGWNDKIARVNDRRGGCGHSGRRWFRSRGFLERRRRPARLLR